MPVLVACQGCDECVADYVSVLTVWRGDHWACIPDRHHQVLDATNEAPVFHKLELVEVPVPVLADHQLPARASRRGRSPKRETGPPDAA